MYLASLRNFSVSIGGTCFRGEEERELFALITSPRNLRTPKDGIAKLEGVQESSLAVQLMAHALDLPPAPPAPRSRQVGSTLPDQQDHHAAGHAAVPLAAAQAMPTASGRSDPLSLSGIAPPASLAHLSTTTSSAGSSATMTMTSTNDGQIALTLLPNPP